MGIRLFAGVAWLVVWGALTASPAGAQVSTVDSESEPHCAPHTRGCVAHRTTFVVEPEEPGLGDLERYFPQELIPGLYRDLGMVEDPLTCDRMGNGLTLSRQDVVAAPFVPLTEAVSSGLLTTEYDFFLADRRNYLVWPIGGYQARGERGPAGWLPARNRCWYLRRYLEVKERWSLAMDQLEHDAVQDVLDTCSWGDFDPVCGGDGLADASVVPDAVPAPLAQTEQWASFCDSDGDGRVSCQEASACGSPLPVTRGDPLYPLVFDVDGDGVACR